MEKNYIITVLLVFIILLIIRLYKAFRFEARINEEQNKYWGLQNIYVTYKLGHTVLIDKVNIIVSPDKNIIPIVEGYLNEVADNHELDPDLIDYKIYLTV